MQRYRFRAGIAAFAAIAVLAACGGGGGSPLPHASPSTAPTATSTPASLPSPAAQSNTKSISPSTTASTTATLPATGGISASIIIPKLTAGTGNVAVTVATGGDAIMSRAAYAAARHSQAMPGGTYLLQMDFVPDHDMTFAAVPGFSLDVTQYVTSAGLSIAQAAAYLQTQTLYAGVVDNAGNFNIVGPLAISATSSALTIDYSGPPIALTLKANQHYTVGVHLGPITAPTSSPTASPTPTPTPTASPTPSPTPSPSPTPTATPTPTPSPTPTPVPLALTTDALSFGGTGASYTQTFTLSGGVAPYGIASYDASIVTVAPDLAGGGKYDVTPLKAGTTTIDVHDSAGQTAAISVTVTTLSGVIQ